MMLRESTEVKQDNPHKTILRLKKVKKPITKKQNQGKKKTTNKQKYSTYLCPVQGLKGREGDEGQVLGHTMMTKKCPASMSHIFFSNAKILKFWFIAATSGLVIGQNCHSCLNQDLVS